MMRRTGSRGTVACAIVAVLLAAGLCCAPRGLAEAVRPAVRDVSRPGQALAICIYEHVEKARLFSFPGSACERGRAAQQAAAVGRSLRAELEQAKLRLRQARLENARLRRELEEATKLGGAPFIAAKGEPLFVPELIEAAVIGRETSFTGPAGGILDQGAASGLADSQIVLRAEGNVVIDQGAEERLAAGQAVYAGRCVAGRIARAGRWTSTVLPITAREFRAAAQLVRVTPDGHAFGPRGILQGAGETAADGGRCRLRHVPSTESVSEGVEVYTAHDGALPAPMYLGRVVRAVLPPGAPEWDIDVRPAVTSMPQTVYVLRRHLNPERAAAR